MPPFGPSATTSPAEVTMPPSEEVRIATPEDAIDDVLENVREGDAVKEPVSEGVEQLARELCRVISTTHYVVGKSPTALAAASLYLAANIYAPETEEYLPQYRVAKAAGVCDVTIRNHYEKIGRCCWESDETVDDLRFEAWAEAVNPGTRGGKVLPDGGSKYVNETGDGYLGIWASSRWTVKINIGTFDHIDWRSDDDVWVVDADQGIAVVDEPPAETVTKADGYLTKANVTRTAVGRAVKVPARALRQLEGFAPDQDLRGYRRDGHDLVLVPAQHDPFVEEGGS